MTMELTCLGHATLLVRCGERRVLCDPIFSDELSGGGNLIYPYRRVNFSSLHGLDAVLLSHHHSDHFCLEELERLPEARKQRFVIPFGSWIGRALRDWGAARIDEVRPGQSIELGGLSVTMTPSAASFPEMGFLFRYEDTAALNLVDTRLDGVMPALRALVPSNLQLALAPFQAGGYESLWPLRVGGPPSGLVERIMSSARGALAALVENITQLRPRHVATFADGIVYKDPQINAWHFPLPDEVFIHTLAQLGIEASSTSPGVRFEVTQSGVRRGRADSSIVDVSFAPAMARSFDPSTRLDDVPMACHRLRVNDLARDDGMAEHATARSTLSPFEVARLAERLGEGLPSKLDSMGDDRAPTIAALTDWFIELCDVAHDERFLVPEIHRGMPAHLRVASAPPAGRRHGLRMHGTDLRLVLDEELELEHVKFSGALRYHSPPIVTNEEATEQALFLPLYVLASWED